MKRSAIAIANFFLDIAKGEEVGLTPLKIQKLVYISHGWHLGLTDGEPLVTDEYVEAWKYGPVYPSVYYAFMEYGGEVIEDYGREVHVENGQTYHFEIPRVSDDDVEVHKLLNRIWEVYGGFSGLVLSSKTHTPNSPWARVKAECPGLRNGHIPNELITEYYQKLRRGK